MTGQELKRLRNASGMTAKSLGKALGLSMSTIYGWEYGKSPIPERWDGPIMRVLGMVPVPVKTKSTVKKSLTISPVEKGAPESTDREEVSMNSTCPPVEVRLCSTIELGPETMKAIKDLIETAVREIAKTQVKNDIVIKPEVINAKREGDWYRAQAQEKLGREW